MAGNGFLHRREHREDNDGIEDWRGIGAKFEIGKYKGASLRLTSGNLYIRNGGITQATWLISISSILFWTGDFSDDINAATNSPRSHKFATSVIKLELEACCVVAAKRTTVQELGSASNKGVSNE
jgi:hypothetical protein